MTKTTTAKPSGYSSCPCRDCMEVAMDGDLCGDCEEAGCEAHAEQECCSPTAYGCGEEVL